MRIFIIISACFLLSASAHSQQQTSGKSSPPSAPILTGADQMGLYLPLLKGQSVAVFANQTSRVGTSHLVDTLLKEGIHIKKIFSPEHGFRGTADAGEHVNNLTDPNTGIPVISLYGNKQRPSVADLADVDVMLFDIQDVGVRFYTYISSLQGYLESAIENRRPLIILDRPNPNGFYVDGPVLDTAFKSFVGMQSVPIVYGMTIGEYARMLIGEQWFGQTITREFNMIPAGNKPARKFDSLVRTMHKRPIDIGRNDFHLILIPCRNYTHNSKYVLPVRPSPNLPNSQSVYLYPSLCFFEGTDISLGRGTNKPFQQFGSPAFPANLYAFTPRSTEGAKNPPLLNQTCYGYDLSEINTENEPGRQLSLKWLLKAYELFPDKEKFFLKSGNFFNKLAGNNILIQQVKDGVPEKEIRKSWEPALGKFKMIRKKYLLYPDFTP
jgi:uncharacterized protein YbbC (DUF1343 family)